jgi:hypothetical protein
MSDSITRHTDILKRRFAYDDWAARRMTRDVLFVWNMMLNGNELPGLAMQRMRRIEPAMLLDGEMRSHRLALRDGRDDAPRVHLQSIWRDPTQPAVMIRTDVFECASAADAREKALWMLGEFESPLIEPTAGIGDVAFASRGETLLLFVRANLVFLLRSIGPLRTETRTAALVLDTAAIATPESHRCAVPNRTRSDRAAAPSPVEATPDATIEATVAEIPDDLDELASRKFAAPEGEIAYSRGAIVYRGPRAGFERLTAYEWP